MYFLFLIIYNFFFRTAENNFKIYWSVPTNSCRRFKVDFTDLISSGDIIQNTNDSVRGDKVVILYNPGKWPTIDFDKTGRLIYQNGGLPFNGSINDHLTQLQIDIDKQIPNKTYDGIAVVDFEEWRPIFRQNFGDHKIYKESTLLYVNRKHPTWTRDQIEAQATTLFENGALNFMNRTIRRARKLRPNALWGFYGYPHCFNRYRTQLEKCPDIVETENNKLMFLYSGVIYTSIYISKNQTDTALTKFVQGKMYETRRLAKMMDNSTNVKLLPFIRYEYTDSKDYMKQVEYFTFCRSDMMNILKTIKSEGGHSVILWGSSSNFKTESQCRAFRDYYDREFISIVKGLKTL
ncbi:unnamed protein product [Chironomus riparius]|uniref:Hyaluronidase n=1 Tax=Chironomus riparius TaxID=315576 RepID=A0A9N9RMQ5_9DIPT|nr:unnamed protein product [Chironomus riparius]